jgi:hypothetical protein
MKRHHPLFPSIINITATVAAFVAYFWASAIFSCTGTTFDPTDIQATHRPAPYTFEEAITTQCYGNFMDDHGWIQLAFLLITYLCASGAVALVRHYRNTKKVL